MICKGGEFCTRFEITDEYGLTDIKEGFRMHGSDKLQNQGVISWELGSGWEWGKQEMPTMFVRFYFVNAVVNKWVFIILFYIFLYI